MHYFSPLLLIINYKRPFKFRHLYKLFENDKLSMKMLQVTIGNICLDLDKNQKVQKMNEARPL
ncbi:hypothetical protein HMPREF0496_2217 [Lentilactobacillus hilgardii ATCC 27305]|nr:hypothetical protein HMPREF0496_2217 [Lentilactobacillus hilgardii ATCC 27305]